MADDACVPYVGHSKRLEVRETRLVDAREASFTPETGEHLVYDYFTHILLLNSATVTAVATAAFRDSEVCAPSGKGGM